VIPVVGNDVVDLDEAGAPRERFVARVLSEEERTRLAASEDPRTLLWTLFAAKEAAYKVVTKLGPARPFAHRHFRVAADLRSVSVGDTVLHLSVEARPAWVHAVASTAPVVVSAVAEVAPGADLSLEARALLGRGLARDIGCEIAELEVVREPREGSWDGFGPPRVIHAGSPLETDVSLSHDGRFVAVAYCVSGGAGAAPGDSRTSAVRART
jgi:phosphopantetheinyl transferase (holo-ACP synthase)